MIILRTVNFLRKFAAHLTTSNQFGSEAIRLLAGGSHAPARLAAPSGTRAGASEMAYGN